MPPRSRPAPGAAAAARGPAARLAAALRLLKPSLAFSSGAVERAFWASAAVKNHLLATDIVASVWVVGSNSLYLRVVRRATAAMPPETRFFEVAAAWTAAIVLTQAVSTRLLAADRGAYFARHRSRMVKLARCLRLGYRFHITLMASAVAAPPLLATGSLLRVLLLHTGAVFSFEHVIALPLPFDWQCLFILASMPGGLMGARVVGGSTIRAAGLQGQACAVFQAARRLSVRRWPALLGGASTLAAAATAAGAGACPPQAEDIVAMGAFALVGLLVPLAAAWLVEVSYRTRFARSHGLLSVARGPAALHWPAALRFSVVESAIVAGGVLFISALDLFSDFYLT